MIGKVAGLLVLMEVTLQQVATRMDLRTATKFANCPSINEIHFEGICSSSWAISVASVASDEFCAVNSTLGGITRFSYQNMMECCSDCYVGYDTGCYGGNFISGMKYLSTVGVVTGSMNGTVQTFCKNYKLRECYLDPTITGATLCTASDFDFSITVDACSKNCSTGGQNYVPIKMNYNQISQGGFSNYADAIKAKIIANWIVVTEMSVFEDLYAYKSGDIYVHLYGRSVGTLTVAIVGFDTSPDTKQDYWIVRMPWGKKFGDNGFIKIQRGTNNSGIENPGNAYYISMV